MRMKCEVGYSPCGVQKCAVHAQGLRKHFKGGQVKSNQYYPDRHLHRAGSTLYI